LLTIEAALDGAADVEEAEDEVIEAGREALAFGVDVVAIFFRLRLLCNDSVFVDCAEDEAELEVEALDEDEVSGLRRGLDS